MNRNDLLTEARALSRPCVRLAATPDGREPVAFWGAASVAGEGHLLSIDLGRIAPWCPALPRTGVATLRMVEEPLPTFAVESRAIDWSALVESRPARKELTNPYTGVSLDEALVWPGLEDRAVFLFAYEDSSLPHADRLFIESERIQAWLIARGREADEAHKSAFEKYESAYQEHVWGIERTVPDVGRGRTFVMLGGWHVPYGTGGYCDPPGDLVLTTLATAGGLLIDAWHVDGAFTALAHYY
jgi:hypothetical protein